MSALRTITCPTCGKRHYIGAPCPEARESSSNSHRARIVLIPLVMIGTALAIIGVSLAVANAKSMGYGIAVALGAWFVVHLFRLGYEWEDGIDVRQLLFPGPFDWPVKIERFFHFWTSPRPWFRAVYIGTVLGFIVVAILLLAGRP